MQQISSLTLWLKSKISLLFGLLVFVGILGLLFYADSRFRVKDIIIQGQSGKKIEINGLHALEDKQLLFLDEQEEEEFITSRNSYIKSVSITKQYPDTLVIKAEYFKPLAVLQTADGFFLLSDEAHILEKSRESIGNSLPIITYYQTVSFSNYQAGQQLNFKEIQDSIYFLQKLAALRIAVNSIDIQGFHMLGLYTTDEEFLFSSEKDRQQQEYQLEATIREFRISGSKLSSLDVRFDKPVVVMQ